MSRSVRTLLACIAALLSTPLGAQPAQRPNILVIMSDDVGQTNVGIYSHGMMVPTPNIDRIGREGMLFTDHYAHPSCTPERRSSSPSRCGPASRSSRGSTPRACTSIRT
jgi:hypothetical protein